MKNAIILVLSMAQTLVCCSPTSTPQATGNIYGQVELAGEVQFDSVLVSLAGGNGDVTKVTDQAGYFEFENVSVGPHELRLSSFAFKTYSTQVTVSPGKNTLLNKFILYPQVSKVSGSASQYDFDDINKTVVGPTGGVWVTLQRVGRIRGGSSNDLPITVRSNHSDFSYSIDLPVGAYSLSATIPTASPVELVFLVLSESPTEVTSVELHEVDGFFQIKGTLNGGPSSTTTEVPTVTLNFSGMNATQTKVGLSSTFDAAGCAWGPTEPYVATRSFIFPSEGLWTVCVTYLDGKGYETPPNLQRIIYDSTP